MAIIYTDSKSHMVFFSQFSIGGFYFLDMDAIYIDICDILIKELRRNMYPKISTRQALDRSIDGAGRYVIQVVNGFLTFSLKLCSSGSS